MRNKLSIFSSLNMFLWLIFKFQYSLKLDMLLDPEGPSRFAPLILLYLVFIVPVVTLGILIYCIFKLRKKQFEKKHIGVLIINTTLLLMMGITLKKYI